MRDLEDGQYTAVQYMWATLRAHHIMAEYTKRNFYEHPSVSAVIAHHLAANHTRPEDADSKLSNRVKALETQVTAMTSKLDKLESKMNEVKNGQPKAPKK